MRDYRVAYYIRLSLADEDTGEKAESNSIGNQRELINRFLDRHPQLKDAPRTEFVDDGFTGTNTNRPGFQALMQELRSGAVNVLITKDFSRCHRDYTQMGNYLECVFPFLNVRYISINDGYDSDDYKGTTSGMDVVLRNIIYESYSKDLSIKTRTAKIIMMKQGKYIGSFAPYGFQFHPTIRNRLAIDEESAAVVRRIFAAALDGMGGLSIARMLNDEKIPSPGEYFRMKHPGSNRFPKASGKNGWLPGAVLSILHQYEYTGAIVGGKRVKASLHEKRTVAQDTSDWIIFENAHDAIISKEDFDRVQEIIRQHSRPSRGQAHDYPLKGILKCANCRRTLKREHSTVGYYYRCTTNRTERDADCPRGKLFGEAEIEKTVFEAVKQMLLLCEERKKQRGSLLQTRKEQIAACVATIKNLQQQQDRFKQEKLRAYEGYSSETVTREEYFRQRTEIDKKMAGVQAELDKQNEILTNLEQLAIHGDNAEADVYATYAGATALTTELVQTFIKEVLVSSPTEIEIVWKFRDVFDGPGNGA